jgi:hypothetical protein
MTKQPGSKQITCNVDQNLLDTLIQSLLLLKSSGENSPGSDSVTSDTETRKTRGKRNLLEPPDNTDLNSVLSHLLSAVQTLPERVSEIQSKLGDCNQMKQLFSEDIRSHSDEIDELRQRQLKGNLIISSSPNGSKACLIKTDEKLLEENQSLTDHVLTLIETKFEVKVPIPDVQALHRLQNGNILLKLWNRCPGSAWWKIAEGIKKGKNKNVNLYANFQLTRKRSALLYHLREKKRENKIYKFYSDENGSISFRVSENSKKIRATFYNKNSTPKTLLPGDVDLILDSN